MHVHVFVPIYVAYDPDAVKTAQVDDPRSPTGYDFAVSRGDLLEMSFCACGEKRQRPWQPE